MKTTTSPRQASIDSATMRGEDRQLLGGDRDQIANDLYPDDTELGNAFQAGWNRAAARR